MDTDFVKTFSASAALASQRPDLPTRLAKNSGITSTYDVAVGRIERNRATYVRETLEGCGEFLCRPPGSAHASRPLTMFIGGVEPGGTCSEAC